jgi:iron complex outermembrane receptor protein
LSLIKGNDISNQIPLINIPPASVYGNVTYRLNRSVNFRHVKYSEIEFELGHHIVFKKSGLLENQDYKPAPPAYQLTNLFFKIDNLFDIKYRDYLNFQRYFADDLGRSIIVGINFKF